MFLAFLLIESIKFAEEKPTNSWKDAYDWLHLVAIARYEYSIFKILWSKLLRPIQNIIRKTDTKHIFDKKKFLFLLGGEAIYL